MSRDPRQSFLVEEDVWEDQAGGAMMRVYRKGQRITEAQAVAAGLVPHPDEPKAELLQAEAEEPKPQKQRKRKTVDGDKAREPAKNKARKAK
jgi:hypothetical protein